MPMTEFFAEAVLNQTFPGTPYTFPSTLYLGLLIAPTWTASASVNAGAYTVGTAFNSTNRHIYYTSGGGTTGGSEPAWNQGNGATTSDGSVTWTEATLLFDGGTFTGAEPVGNNYARYAASCSSGNWNTATAGPPSQVTNKAVFTFNTPSGTGWGQAVGTVTFDASSGGHALSWQVLSVQVACGNGTFPTFSAGSFSVTLG